MGRTRMVTRTITSYEVEVLSLNVVTCEVSSVTYTLDESHAGGTEEKVLKYIQKTYDNDIIKNVKITDIQENEKLYGMSEEDFMKYAQELPPRVIQG